MTDIFNEKPKVSVIVPVFNAGNYLETCLESLINQTLQDIEIICVDDGSTDNTLNILKKYASIDRRLHFYQQQNLSAGAARNLGIEKAKGSYLYFADADDYCDKFLLENCVSKAENDNADIVVFDFCRFDDANKKRYYYNGLNRSVIENYDNCFSYKDYPDYICEIINPTPWNKVINRKFIIENQIYFMPLTTTNDITFATLSAIYASKIAYIPETYYYYRIGQANTITQKKRDNLDNIIKAVLEVDRRSQELSYYDDIKTSLRTFIAQNLFVGMDRYAGDIDTVRAMDYYRKMGCVFSSYLLFLIPDKNYTLNTQLNIRIEECKNNASESSKYTYAPKIVVSLTSYPKRIMNVYKTLASIYRQTKKPDKVVLWLAQEQFNDNVLPKELEEFKEWGLDIRFVSDDLKSHKKYFYAMKEFSEDIIITIDDDLIYPADMIEKLFKSYLKFPKSVSAMRTHLMLVDVKGNIEPYAKWIKDYTKIIHQPCMQLLATTGAGTLFPPHCISEKVFDVFGIKNVALYADDLWIKIMLVLTGTSIVLAYDKPQLNYIEGSQEEALWHYNVKKGGNDTQLNDILLYLSKAYGLASSFIIKNMFVEDKWIYRLQQSEELQNIRLENKLLLERIQNTEFEIMGIKKSFSFRIGRIITWLPRKSRGAIRCLREHDLEYTLRRVLEHIGIDMGTEDFRK